MPKFYKDPHNSAQLDIICKHCGHRYGMHNYQHDGCPLFDEDGQRIYGKHSTTQFFEPSETFLE